MVPKLICGEYARVRSAISKVVGSVASGDELRCVLDESLLEVHQVPGLFVIESATYKELLPLSVHHVWCDAVLSQVERYVPRGPVRREWAESLLQAEWGGLVFLSQLSNGLLRSREFCLRFVDWFLRNANLIEEIGDRFAIGASRGYLWSHGNNLAGALAELGVGHEDIRACGELSDLVMLGEQARGAHRGS